MHELVQAFGEAPHAVDGDPDAGEAEHRDEKNNEFFKYDDAKKALAVMQKSFDQVVAIAKAMSRSDSDRLLQFCLEHAKNADYDSSK